MLYYDPRTYSIVSELGIVILDSSHIYRVDWHVVTFEPAKARLELPVESTESVTNHFELELLRLRNSGITVVVSDIKDLTGLLINSLFTKWSNFLYFNLVSAIDEITVSSISDPIRTLPGSQTSTLEISIPVYRG